MITGKNLNGARVRFSDDHMTAENVVVNSNGTCLFLDLAIDPQAKLGTRRVKVITPEGTAPTTFEILRSLPAVGRFSGFSPDDVIYLIMPDRFADGDPANNDPETSPGLFHRGQTRYYHGGDFQGIINHLPYLKDLGVTALWLTPWYNNSGEMKAGKSTDYHGYGAVDFYGVEEHFGNLAKLRELVDAAHQVGIKVIQDQVVNHTSPRHQWVTNPPTSTWYNGSVQHHLVNQWHTESLISSNSSPELQKQTLEGWFKDTLPDLNQNDPECARYLTQNSLWWIGVTGIDGIRLDTLPYVPRTFWRDWRAAVKKEYPRLNVVGEMYNGNVEQVSFFQGDRVRFDGVDSGIESLFDFPLFYAVRKTFAESKSMTKLTGILEQDRQYVNPEMLVTFLGLHDVARFMNEPGADTTGLKLAFTFLITMRGIPMIYYGDELGMRGGKDPDNRRDFPGGFPGDSENAFESARRMPEQSELFEHCQRLLRLRARLAPLRHGQVQMLMKNETACVYARVLSDAISVVAFNNSKTPATLEFDLGQLKLNDKARLHDQLGNAPEVTSRDGKLRVLLDPRSAAVYTPVP